jgi:hypothetical protein
MTELGRVLIGIGLVLIVIGVAFWRWAACPGSGACRVTS